MGPQLKVVEKTRTATMLCAASGNPDPEISWFKDMLPVDIGNSNGRIKQLRSGTALTTLEVALASGIRDLRLHLYCALKFEISLSTWSFPKFFSDN